MKEFKKDDKVINSRNIFVDESYQRVLHKRDVDEIVKTFNPNVINKPKLSYREGRYYVYNGQHTIAALKELNGGKDLMIECEVRYGMTREDEAELFALQNGHEKKVTVAERLNSLYVSGDMDVINFKSLVQSFGYTCDFKDYGGPGRLICYSSAYGIYSQVGGAERLAEILGITSVAWDLDAEGVRREILCGMNALIKDNPDKIDDKRMIKKLKTVSPSKIIRLGNEKTKGGNKRFEQEIADIYNSGLRSGNRLIVRW